ncbi:helix-turn-helix transcriptional regulator [Streptomyces sp. 184]|uniref:helix-turn-helix transcriptional regulator n=1 Tax=Streptomyces sp. 184 TaxID=1827526 RepID=UPI003891D0DD
MRTDDPIERAIDCLWKRYSEPLSLTEIAESALLSRFYFSRLFKDATGVTPGRFLAAVRVHQAKHLLLHTPLRIADVSTAVGYSSLGSFTNYFTSSVGVSPGRYRHIARGGGFDLPGPRPGPRAGCGAIAGTLDLPAGHGNAHVYVGAFRTPIVQYPPSAAVLVRVPVGRPGAYRLPDVPEGTWHVHAVGVAEGVWPDPWHQRTSLVGSCDAVAVAAERTAPAGVRLRRERPADPPVLLALPALEPLPPPAAGPRPALLAAAAD